ncbi:MAG: GNAT family N-acetyltransferase [candidate division WOR-3 bacterium]
MPLCKDPLLIKPLLLSDPDRTHSIANLVFNRAGARAAWVRVDALDNPQAVVCRWRFLYLFARSRAAARAMLAELPTYWKLSFAATPAELIATVRQVLRPRGRGLSWIAPCRLYVLDPVRGNGENHSRVAPGARTEQGRSNLVFHCQHPVGHLALSDAPLVTKHWPHGRSQRYIEWRIQSGPTAAIRRRGQLVAWALTHSDGAMGILHVLEEYRGQGMARSITTALARRCIKAGIKPFLYIVKTNVASIRLTESMGFTYSGEFAWFGE